MKNFARTAVALAALTIVPTHTNAQETSAPKTGHLSFSIGYFDAFDDDGATDFRVEYRPERSLGWQNLKPWLGIEATTDATIWGGGGLLYDWSVAPQWHLIPSLGAGLYIQGDSDKDLDHPIEFRSQLELAYDIGNDDQIGVAFSHMSNFDLGDNNPGAETLSLYYHYGF